MRTPESGPRRGRLHPARPSTRGPAAGCLVRPVACMMKVRPVLETPGLFSPPFPSKSGKRTAGKGAAAGWWGAEQRWSGGGGG